MKIRTFQSCIYKFVAIIIIFSNSYLVVIVIIVFTLFAGLLPFNPTNVSVRQQSDGLLISWLPPTTSPVPIESYVLEFRTVGQWVTLAHQGVDKPWFLWKTVSRGVTYQFRVISMADALRVSEPSPSVTYLSTS